MFFFVALPLLLLLPLFLFLPLPFFIFLLLPLFIFLLLLESHHVRRERKWEAAARRAIAVENARQMGVTLAPAPSGGGVVMVVAILLMALVVVVALAASN